MLQQNTEVVIYYYFAGTIFILLLILFIISYVLFHHKKVWAYKFKLKQEELEKEKIFYEALHEGEEKERKRLSEELHEGIGAKLSGIKMKLEFVSGKAGKTEYAMLLSDMTNEMNNCIEELREISHNLIPIAIQEKSLKELIENYIGHLNLDGKCDFKLFYELPDGIALGTNLKSGLFRILSELLHNACKHSNATLVTVQISIDENKIEAIVEDNGSGIKGNVSKKHGIGLQNIYKRVELLGGKINIDSTEKGTTVILSLILNQ